MKGINQMNETTCGVLRLKNSSESVLVEIPFIFITHDGKELCFGYLDDRNKVLRLWRDVDTIPQTIRSVCNPEDNHVEYYTTQDICWFKIRNSRGLVKHLPEKPHRGIQTIKYITDNIEPPRPLKYYEVLIEDNGRRDSIPIYVKDILSFKKFQQTYLEHVGKIIPTIKKQIWEEVLAFYLEKITSPETKRIGEPKLQEIRHLQDTIEQLKDRLGDETRTALKKRFADDKKVMDGVLK